MATKKKSKTKAKSKAKKVEKPVVEKPVVESVPDTPSKKAKPKRVNPITARNKSIREFPKQAGYWSKMQRKFKLTPNQLKNILKGKDA